MRHLLRDMRFGLRLLLKNPGFTAVTVLTLSLGIAATTAIFSVVHATFFAPLPYRDADRLVMVWSQREGGGRNSNSPADYLDFKRETSVFEDLNTWTGRFVSLGSGGAPMQLEAGTPAPGFLPMLGFGHPLAIGRDFLEAEATLGREQVVILSYSLWQERFGGDRSILGQAIRIDGKPYEVVGVLGQGPADNIQFRLWIPLAYPEAVAADRQGGRLVAVVNETFVKRVFGATDPLTQRLELGRIVPGANQPGEPQVWQIVGVVADSRSNGVKNDIAREIHLPFDQSPFPRVRMTVRSEGDPTALQKSIAAVIQRLDPDLPMGNVRTMDQVVAQTLVGDRFTTALFAGFATVALILAALGIYGVMSFAVAQRTHEIGLRIALGAGRGRVLWQVLREGLLTALAGTILGSAGAWFVVRALRDIVFGVTAFAPAAFVGVTLVLLAAALVACLVPATRAASVDPMVALRQD